MRRLLLTLFIAATAAIANGATGSIGALTTSPSCERWVDSVYATLTPRQRLAQLFCPVVDPTKGETSRTVINRYVGTNGMGGLLFRKGSAADYATMANYAQERAAVPVMMTIDGEWGPAMRIAEAPRFPYNMALGAITDMELLEEFGSEVARQCRELGMQVDFAPVADVNLNPANPVIGRRSFGEDPERVAAAVVAVSCGMENGGVMTTAKHFPGHGDTATDSHKTLPVVDHSTAFINDNDLKPFKQYINAGLSGIMVGHLSVPALDPSGTPASMSSTITDGILHNQLNFNGLTFTDALEMKGAALQGENNCISAFKAGADILLSSTAPVADLNAMAEALKNGTIDSREVEKRVRKVLAYKWALGLDRKPSPINVTGLKSRLNTAAAKGLIERLTAASVTVIGNANGTLPLAVDKTIALVNIGQGAGTELADMMKRHANIDLYTATDAAPLTTAKIAEIKKHDIVVAALYSDNAGAVSQLNALTPHPALVVITFTTPYKAMAFKQALKQAEAMVMMYDNNTTARRVAGDAIFGGTGVSGRLPVTMPGIAKAGDGVDYDASRLSFAMPNSTTMPEWLNDSIDKIVRPALRDGAFSGLQVMVIKDGKVVADRNYGKISSQPNAAAVTDETLFDLASMSKAIGTLPAVMKLKDDGMINLDTPIGNYIPELEGGDKADITPRMLLLHESGMPASLNMYETMFDPDSYSGPLTRRTPKAPYTIRVARRTYGNSHARLRRDITSATRSEAFPIAAAKGIWVGSETLDTIMARIYNVPLRDRRTRYSCLNFCLLMDIEQRLARKRHDVIFNETFATPLGANSLVYRPLEHFNASQIAATENDAFLRRQTVHGYVHDELAAFSGGVQGNAGLFGTATDVAKICAMYRNGGSYGRERLISHGVVKEFTEGKAANSRRGLGFDRPDTTDPDRSPVPDDVPASAYGHTGFTGTCFWIDPENDLIFIFLSNRVHPSRENSAWTRHKVRSRIHSLLYKALT